MWKTYVRDTAFVQDEKRDCLHFILNKWNVYARRKADRVLTDEEMNSNESFFVC